MEAAVFGWSVLWGLALFLVYINYVTKLINNILLHKYGVQCQGTILSKRSEVQRSRSSNGRTTETKKYYLTLKIKYDSNDINHKLLSTDQAIKEVRISQGQSKKYKEGNMVKYIYLKSFPSRDKISDIQHESGHSCTACTEICSCFVNDTISNIIFWFILWNGLGATFLWIAYEFGGYVCIILSIIWCIVFMCLFQYAWFYFGQQREMPIITEEDKFEDEKDGQLI